MTNPTPPAPERERTIPGARVDTKRHHPMCNDLCAECVTWRYIDTLQDRIVALVQSYEAKVEDFAAETLRTGALTAKLAAAEAEAQKAWDQVDDLATENMQVLFPKLAAAERHTQEVIADCDEYQRTVGALRGQLAAAEARVAELEAWMDAMELRPQFDAYRATHD